jgi:hypothetical protein
LLALVGLAGLLGGLLRHLGILAGRVAKPVEDAPGDPQDGVGSWLLAGYVPAAGVASGSALTGRLPRTGAAATAGAALLGPAVATYTAVLISDTAVPAWHDGYPELPFVFAGSAATAAAGLGLLAAPPDQSAPGPEPRAARREPGNSRLPPDDPADRHDRRALPSRPERRLPQGRRGPGCPRSGRLAGGIAPPVPRPPVRGRPAGSLGRHPVGIFHARMASARDPKYTVIPQRRRLERQARTHGSFDECLIRLSNANVVSSESGRVPSGGGVVVMVLSYRPCCA